MKKIYGIAALAAAMTLASCSNNDEPNVPSVVKGEKGYLAVNIAAPGLDTRASEAEGEDNESAVDHALLIVFDGDQTTSKVLGTYPVYPEKWETGTGDITKTSTTAVEVDTDEDGDVGLVLCILNPGSLDFDEGTSLSTVRAKIDAYAAAATDENFIMTSTAYGDDNTCGTNFSGEVYKTKEEAEAKAQDIYVERVVAKINYEYSTTNFTSTNPKPTVDGAQKELSIKILGIGVANSADKSYLFKDCSDWSSLSFKNGFEVNGTYRSHWATTPSSLTVSNKTFGDYGTPVNGTKTLLGYFQENTGSSNQTSVLVTAQLMDGENAFELNQLGLDGKYYSAEGLETKVLAMLKDDDYRIKKNNGYSTLGASNISYEALPNAVPTGATMGDNDVRAAYKAYVQIVLGENEELVKYNSKTGEYSDPIDLENTNAALKTAQGYADGSKKYLVKTWTDGQCYYWVPVEAAEAGLAGVVRNHIYNLTINSIKGLGVPVFDPDNVIIPEKPGDDEFPGGEPDDSYIGVSINVLNWCVTSQEVNFNN